jgi:hypothetical protein
MTPRKRARAPTYQPGTLLDWSDSTHWDYDGPAPCRYCGAPTHLRDSGRHPADKVCAEAALAQQANEAAAAYAGQTL